MRAVLWDLDGTLVDSSEYHWQAWYDTMAADGVPITHAQFLQSFGQRNDRILTSWLGASAAGDRIKRLGDAKEAEYRRLARAGGVSALPGAAHWVARLQAEGWQQAIASSAPRLNVEAMVEALGFGQYISAITAAEDVTAGKPDPEVFLKAAAALGVAPSRCIVVEDVAAGIEAARRAAMKCIGVSSEVVLAADIFVRALTDLPPDSFASLLCESGPRSLTNQSIRAEEL